MNTTQLIADSGSTSCDWCLIHHHEKQYFSTQGISPYFLTQQQIIQLLQDEVAQQIGQDAIVSEIHFYGTGLSNQENASTMKDALQAVFKDAIINVNTDMLAAARGLCKDQKGIVCILGTGSNACYYDGLAIQKNSPGLGFILGDEGSGSYLGKKVIQHFLYNTFDEDLVHQFKKEYPISKDEILNKVYKQPFPNRYLATFAKFLHHNRGHYMIENIIEDGLNDFFLTHLYKFAESWSMPIHFVGSVAKAFKTTLQELCNNYELELGTVEKSPLQGLVDFHAK